MLNAHDANNRVGMQTIDINNPPKVPYVHQPFPTTVYHHASGKVRLAKNQTELAEALSYGWERKPYIPPADPAGKFAVDGGVDESFDVELDAETQAELDGTLEKGRRVAAEKAAAEKAARAARKHTKAK